MKEYHFIPVAFREDVYFWDENLRRLNVLLSVCDLITTNYGSMYPIENIKGTDASFRGPIINFKEGGMTYFYNITGGYVPAGDSVKLNDVTSDISWPILTEEERKEAKKHPRQPTDLSAGYEAWGKMAKMMEDSVKILIKNKV